MISLGLEYPLDDRLQSCQAHTHTHTQSTHLLVLIDHGSVDDTTGDSRPLLIRDVVLEGDSGAAVSVEVTHFVTVTHLTLSTPTWATGGRVGFITAAPANLSQE